MNTDTIVDTAPATAPDTQKPAPAARHPARELLARYRAIFGAAWSLRHELAGPRRLADETAFLPAALSLQDTPVHPAPRRLALALMLLFVLALLWACFGKIDIVSVAPGTIIVGDRSKVIQSFEAGVVRRILVRDGEQVKAGQLLVELDTTMASADRASAESQLQEADSERLRSALLLKALAGGAGAGSLPLPAADERQLAALGGAREQLQAEWQDIAARRARLAAEAAKRRAESATVAEGIAKLEALLPLASAREADFKGMLGGGYVSGHAAQDKTRERLELERDLATSRARLAEVQSGLNESEQAARAFVAETRRALNDRTVAAQIKLHQLNQGVAKAAQREQLTRLTSPVDGVVQQLALHTPGGVVTAAQPLMIVVPDAAAVKAAVNIANMDIGFVGAGQHAEIKLETFPFTRYGTVMATVDTVTADAVTDEKKGSYYPAILTLDRKDMQIDGKRVAISPGMNISAEIKTGQRSVIEFLLSPIQRAGKEGLRER